MGSSAFYGCTGFNGTLTISKSLEEIQTRTFYNCSGFTGDLVIPDSVITINTDAFQKCTGFTGNLVIGNSVETIGIRAFDGCSGFAGNLTLPNSLLSIGTDAFSDCTNLTGNVIIPDSVTTINVRAFDNCNNVSKILIKVNSDDIDTNYKQNMIKNLPNTSQTVIDLPYDFDVAGTWLETTKKSIAKPSIKNNVEGIEGELTNGVGEIVSLYIPSLYEESNITVTKDGKPFDLPEKDSDGKYLFTKKGVYQITITTDLGNISVINFEAEGTEIKDAQKAVEQAESSLDSIDISNARYLVNNLPESLIKDELQDRLTNLFPSNLVLEEKKITFNTDIYIKPENSLSMTLSTNSIVFEDFNGVEDMEKINAVKISVSSSLPYSLNAYLATEIQNSDKSSSIDKSILNIRESSETDYKTFTNNDGKVILKENCIAGNESIYNIDLMLKANVIHEKDIYKTAIKFEVEQN